MISSVPQGPKSLEEESKQESSEYGPTYPHS